MDFDIFNSKPRPVRCIRTNTDLWTGNNGHLLTEGEIYNVTDVVVSSWYTDVYIEEYPGVEFNSVLFEEV